MIAKVSGKILLKTDKFVVVDVGGLGYKVGVSADTLAKIKQGDISLFTHLHVREDELDLYGFLDQSELEFFEMLIGISGIGPKSALGIIGVASIETLKKAIASGDNSYLTKVSGVGRKTAEKIVLELKDKMGFGKVPYIEGGPMQDDADVMEALISLGYSQKESREMVQNIPATVKGRDQRLKEALKTRGTELIT